MKARHMKARRMKARSMKARRVMERRPEASYRNGDHVKVVSEVDGR